MDCWQVWGWAFTPTSPFESNHKTARIYVKTAKDKKHCQVGHWSSMRTKWTLQSISSVALPLPATPKGVTKRAFIYGKRAKSKNSVTSYLRVPRIWNGQCKQFHARLYPCQQPQKGKHHMGNEIGFYLC